MSTELPLLSNFAWRTQFSIITNPLGGSIFGLSQSDSDDLTAAIDSDYSAVPTPSAVWLLSSALVALLGFKRKHSLILKK